MPICRIYAYLRGKHLFERGRLFHFLVFQPRDSICLSSTQTKKLSNETTTYFSINTQVCYVWSLAYKEHIKVFGNLSIFRRISQK